MIKIAPSILAADPLHLGRDIERAAASGCDWIHVDVMDAHFVPNLAYTPETVRSIRKMSSLPIDVHLMMDHPETLLDAFLKAGADHITIHAEIASDIPALLKRIHEGGAHAGIALKPGTPIDAVLPYCRQADLILAMTVEPGFGGQTLDRSVLKKIGDLRDAGYKGEIEADGGITEDNIDALISQGLTVAVMGTALFRDENMGAAVERLHARA